MFYIQTEVKKELVCVQIKLCFFFFVLQNTLIRCCPETFHSWITTCWTPNTQEPFFTGAGTNFSWSYSCSLPTKSVRGKVPGGVRTIRRVIPPWREKKKKKKNISLTSPLKTVLPADVRFAHSCGILGWTTGSRCSRWRLPARSTSPSLCPAAPCAGMWHPDVTSLRNERGISQCSTQY